MAEIRTNSAEATKYVDRRELLWIDGMDLPFLMPDDDRYNSFHSAYPLMRHMRAEAAINRDR